MSAVVSGLALLCTVGCTGDQYEDGTTDTRPKLDDSTNAGDLVDEHGHPSRYHFQPYATRVSVDFPEPIGTVYGVGQLQLQEPESNNRKWNAQTGLMWSFRPPPESRENEYERATLSVPPPSSSYGELEGTYTTDNNKPRPAFWYTNGKSGDELVSYTLQENSDDPGKIMIRDVDGTRVTVTIEVTLERHENPKQTLDVQKTFTSDWGVSCIHKRDDGNYYFDVKKESEFCRQFKRAPWPHVHQGGESGSAHDADH